MNNLSTYYIYENNATHEKRFARNVEELYRQLEADGISISRNKIKSLYNRIGFVNSNDFRITFMEQKTIYKALIDAWIK